jgi:hypothetical protein
MHIAVTYTAIFQPDQHFRAPGLGHLPLGRFQRPAPFDDIITQHGSLIAKQANNKALQFDFNRQSR